MSALAERWAEQRERSRIGTAFAWWLAALAGGAAGGLLTHALGAAAASAILVGLLQALSFRADLRYGSAWFFASSIAGALGFSAMVVGASAFAEVAGREPAALREGLIAWISLAGLGGLLLGAAQAPLSGRRGLGTAWAMLALSSGALLWPLGFAAGHRFGPEAAERLSAALPALADANLPLTQSAAFACAWLLFSLPFGLLVAANSAGRR